MNSSNLEEIGALSKRGFEFAAQGLNMYCRMASIWMDYTKLFKFYQDLSRAFFGALPLQTGIGSPADLPRLQQDQFNAIARSWSDYIKMMSEVYHQDTKKTKETA